MIKIHNKFPVLCGIYAILLILLTKLFFIFLKYTQISEYKDEFQHIVIQRLNYLPIDFLYLKTYLLIIKIINPLRKKCAK